MIKQTLLFCSVAFLMVACNNKSNKESTKIIKEEKIVKVESPEILEGKKYFNQYCMACHMEDGLGVSGMNPPLSRTSWVLGDKDKLIGVVLNGLSGDIEINGELYSNTMGSFAMLKDKEIALILTYVRQAFGNDADQVSEQNVSKVRALLN